MPSLANKVAVITGAASGIGLAGVETFVEKGAKVVAADLQTEKGKALEARFGNDRVTYVNCDVTELDSLKALIGSAVETYGSLDILWNNAGHGGLPGGIEEYDPKGWQDTMNLLLNAVFAGTHYAIPHMKEKGGAIINTSSVSAVCAGYAPITYSVAKRGVAHFSKLAAAELAKYKIRVNAILPGFIATSIFGASIGMDRQQADQMAEMLSQNGAGIQPIGRAGQPQDIAQMASFLASDEASFITGGEFLVDGGITTGPRHSWSEDQSDNPILKALGISPEEAERLAAAVRSSPSQ